jgi:hypothetical protein
LLREEVLTFTNKLEDLRGALNHMNQSRFKLEKELKQKEAEFFDE